MMMASPLPHSTSSMRQPLVACGRSRSVHSATNMAAGDSSGSFFPDFGAASPARPLVSPDGDADDDVSMTSEGAEQMAAAAARPFFPDLDRPQSADSDDQVSDDEEDDGTWQRNRPIGNGRRQSISLSDIAAALQADGDEVPMPVALRSGKPAAAAGAAPGSELMAHQSSAEQSPRRVQRPAAAVAPRQGSSSAPRAATAATGSGGAAAAAGSGAALYRVRDASSPSKSLDGTPPKGRFGFSFGGGRKPSTPNREATGGAAASKGRPGVPPRARKDSLESAKFDRAFSAPSSGRQGMKGVNLAPKAATSGSSGGSGGSCMNGNEFLSEERTAASPSKGGASWLPKGLLKRLSVKWSNKSTPVEVDLELLEEVEEAARRQSMDLGIEEPLDLDAIVTHYERRKAAEKEEREKKARAMGTVCEGEEREDAEGGERKGELPKKSLGHSRNHSGSGYTQQHSGTMEPPVASSMHHSPSFGSNRHKPSSASGPLAPVEPMYPHPSGYYQAARLNNSLYLHPSDPSRADSPLSSASGFELAGPLSSGSSASQGSGGSCTGDASLSPTGLVGANQGGLQGGAEQQQHKVSSPSGSFAVAARAAGSPGSNHEAMLPQFGPLPDQRAAFLMMNAHHFSLGGGGGGHVRGHSQPHSLSQSPESKHTTSVEGTYGGLQQQVKTLSPLAPRSSVLQLPSNASAAAAAAAAGGAAMLGKHSGHFPLGSGPLSGQFALDPNFGVPAAGPADETSIKLQLQSMALMARIHHARSGMVGGGGGGSLPGSGELQARQGGEGREFRRTLSDAMKLEEFIMGGESKDGTPESAKSGGSTRFAPIPGDVSFAPTVTSLSRYASPDAAGVRQNRGGGSVDGLELEGRGNEHNFLEFLQVERAKLQALQSDLHTREA